MAIFKLSNKAVEDLSAIWNYTFEEWSETQADTYYKMLLKHCQKVAVRPQLGKKFADIGVMVWASRAKQHIVFYTINSPEEIFIVRILHGRMDLLKRLSER